MKKSIFALFTILFMVFTLVGVYPVNGATPIPINEARSKPVGTQVTVQGIVTVKPGTFDRGFAIQDSTGGIYVYPQTKASFNLGDEVLVSGSIANYKGLVEVKPLSSSDMKFITHKTPVEPKDVKTGEIGAATNGLLVKVTGKVVAKKSYYFYVDDGSGKCEVYIKKYVHIDLSKIQEGETITVIGFSSQYRSYYEILPRGPEDVSIGASSGTEEVPEAPTNLKAKVYEDAYQKLFVQLSWKPVKESGKTKVKYNVYRGEEQGNESLIATVLKPEYKDTNVNDGSVYYYYVTAVNTAGESKPSEEIKVLIELGLNPPMHLVARVKDGKVELTWEAPRKGSSTIAGFAIFRSEESGTEPDVPINVVAADVYSYVDSGVSIGNTYYYFVKSFDNQNPPNYSAPSNEVKVTVESSTQTDSTPPVISVNSPKNGLETDSQTVTVSGTVTDQDSGVKAVYVDGNSVAINSDGSFTYTVSLTEGRNVITIMAEDNAGNKSVKKITVQYKPYMNVPQTTIISLKPNDPYMTVDGKQEEIDPGRGTKPVIIKSWGRTVVPIRAIVEALGGTISWDPVQRMVTIQLNGTTIKLWIGKPQAEVNGEMKWIDENNHNVKPIIVNGRTMLPLRFVAENLGCEINWDPDTRTITITYTP